jgi:hypothetical protein
VIILKVMPPEESPESPTQEHTEGVTPELAGESAEDLDFESMVQERAERLIGTREMLPPGAVPHTEHAFFVDSWRDLPPDEAISLAQDPLTILLALRLEGLGLESILADRYAAAALRGYLIEGHVGIREEIIRCLKAGGPKKKPGRAPDKIKRLLELDGLGWNNAKIAEDIYSDPKAINKVTALRSRARQSLRKASEMHHATFAVI